jgi:hypothetical protein
MNTEEQQAIEKCYAMYEASPNPDPEQCMNEVLTQLIDKSHYEGTDPDKAQEAVEAAATLLALCLSEDEDDAQEDGQ